MVTASCDLHSPCTSENKSALHAQLLTDGPGERIHRAVELTVKAGRQHGWKTKLCKVLGESQDAKNDQDMFHRDRTQATLRKDDTEKTGSERLGKSSSRTLKR